MLKKAFILILCASLSMLCGCAQTEHNTESTVENSSGVKVFVDEDGTTHYQFDEDYSVTEEGRLIVRSFEEMAFLQNENCISLEEAGKILDSCAFRKFSLPCCISNFKKYYNGTVTVKNKEYYSILFYAEKNSARMFVGREALVSATGDAVFAKSILGTNTEVAIGSSKDDVTLYENAAISPIDALFVIQSKEKEVIGLNEDLPCYTFEFSANLFDVKSASCYKITPVLTYENLQKHCSAIYISADGKNSVIITQPETGELEMLD